MVLKEFVKLNYAPIEKYQRFILDNNWAIEDVFSKYDDFEDKSISKEILDKVLVKTKKFDLQHSVVTGVVERVKYFVKTYENEKKKKDYEKFITVCREVIESHLERSETYINNFDISDYPAVYLQEAEMRLSNDIFVKTSKIRELLSGINLTTEDEEGQIEFIKDQYAPLIMHDHLVNIYPQIKTVLDDKGIDFKKEPKPFFHINNKKAPEWEEKKHYFEQEKEVLQYYVDELKKIKRGLLIDGVYISGWMYYHINYFVTKYPTQIFNKKTGEFESEDTIGVPPLRDNEWWVINDNYELAKKNKEMMFIAATRRAAKTTMNASHLGWCMVAGKMNLLIGAGSSSDLGQIADNFSIIQNNINPAFKAYNLVDDWTKSVRYGVRLKNNKPLMCTNIKIVNLEAGSEKKSEAFAGFTPEAVIIDEIMKLAFKAQLAALKPAVDTPYGKRCVVILTGCVCAGTKVFDSNGKIYNIEDVKLGQTLLGYDGKGYSTEKVTWLKPPAKKPCYRLTFTGGTTLECSDDHPILMSNRHNKNRGRFEKAMNLKVGDFAYLINEVAPFGKTVEKDAYLLGLLVGDGCNQDKKGSEIYLEGDSVFNELSKYYDMTVMHEYTTSNNLTYRRAYIKNSRVITEKAKINGLHKDKKILPYNWSEYDKESLSKLIGGLIDSDGSVTKGKKGYRIRFSNCSYHVIEGLKLALMKFGIHATLSRYDRIETKIKGKNYKRLPSYELSISRVKDIKIFFENIKLFSETKQIDFEYLDSLIEKTTESSLRFIDKTYEDKGEFFEGKGDFSGLRRVSVKNVEYIGEQYVYNLTADTTHTYVANGVVTHNTAGNEELAKDSFDVLRDPETNDILTMPWDILNSRVPEEFRTWEERDFGTFIPAQMSAKDGMVKIDSNLATYLGVESPALEKVAIKVTNWEKAKEIILEDREKKKSDIVEYIKEVLYYPISPSDMLLSGKVNPFPVTEGIMHRDYLLSISPSGVGKKVFLTENTQGQVVYTQSNEPLASYPHKGGFIDCPIVLYEELPEDMPPDNLYVAGFDDYKQEQSTTDSIGSFHIYKVDAGFGEKSGEIVASYATRPDPHGKMHHQIYMLQKAFNAKCFMENADTDYQTFLELRRVADVWLVEAIDFDGEATQKNTGKRKYGWNPSNKKNRDKLFSLLLSYTKRRFTVEDEDGNIKTILGIQKINDIGVLDEIIAYKEGNNVDRLTSFMSCLGYEFFLYISNMFPDVSRQLELRRDKQRNESQRKVRKSSNFFAGRTKRKIF